MAKRKRLIAGNWKMNMPSSEGERLARSLREKLGRVKGVEVVLLPPFTTLASVYEIIKETALRLGAQDIHWENEGAFTGEVSGLMLREAGCNYVIVGHSERRTYFGETNETVRKRAHAALTCGLTPIVCVGETLSERENNQTEGVVTRQIQEGLQGFPQEKLARIVIAYEPIWAIGTGRTATPEQANEVHVLIRKLLAEAQDESLAQRVRILYGGSIKPENSEALMAESDIDGGLVGGASLDSSAFTRIVESASGSRK